MARPTGAHGAKKRSDAKRKTLPVGVNFAIVYHRDGTKTENGRIRASFSYGEYKSFSVNKYGEDEAIRLAVAWRADKIRRQKQQ